MAKIVRVVGTAAAKKELNDFKAVLSILKPLLQAMTPAQRQNVRNILNDWGNATTTQKFEALRACIALLYVIVAFLAWKVLEEEN